MSRLPFSWILFFKIFVINNCPLYSLKVFVFQSHNHQGCSQYWITCKIDNQAGEVSFLYFLFLSILIFTCISICTDRLAGQHGDKIVNRFGNLHQNSNSVGNGSMKCSILHASMCQALSNLHVSWEFLQRCSKIVLFLLYILEHWGPETDFRQCTQVDTATKEEQKVSLQSLCSFLFKEKLGYVSINYIFEYKNF